MSSPYRERGPEPVREIHVRFHLPWWMRVLAQIKHPRFWLVFALYLAIPAFCGALFASMFGLDVAVQFAIGGAAFGLVSWILALAFSAIVRRMRGTWLDHIREIVFTPNAILQVPLHGENREIGYACVKKFFEDATFIHLEIVEESFGPLAIAKGSLDSASLAALRAWTKPR